MSRRKASGSIKALWLVGAVVVLAGCAAEPTTGVSLGASAIQAQRTSDAALSLVEIATAARLETRNAIDDAGTRTAQERYRIEATQTREANETAAAAVEKTESASMGATVRANLATYAAQTPTARAIQTAERVALVQQTETAVSARATRTLEAYAFALETQRRAQEIENEKTTAQFRAYVDAGAAATWAIVPIIVSGLVIVILGYGLARIMYAAEIFIRTQTARRQVFCDTNGNPVIYFLPNGEYEILDPKLLPAPSAQVYPTLPLPENERIIEVSRGGGAFEKMPLDLIHGFDPRDLRWLCDYLANGGKWTEAAMENIPLPYSGEKMGKAQGQTPYARWMGLCVSAGIIEGRGGDGNKPGKLIVKEASEMLKQIKQIPQTESSHE